MWQWDHSRSEKLQKHSSESTRITVKLSTSVKLCFVFSLNQTLVCFPLWCSLLCRSELSSDTQARSKAATPTPLEDAVSFRLQMICRAVCLSWERDPASVWRLPGVGCRFELNAIQHALHSVPGLRLKPAQININVRSKFSTLSVS